MKLTILPNEVKVGDVLLGYVYKDIFYDCRYNNTISTKIASIEAIDDAIYFRYENGSSFMPCSTQQLVIERNE